jgi:Patatin-like phospholipase
MHGVGTAPGTPGKLARGISVNDSSSIPEIALSFAAVEQAEKEAIEASLNCSRSTAVPIPQPEEPTSPEQAPDKSGRVGLALSGGGIRSATFSLGVLQALASKKKLASFDYLSTVSGGGYIGSWLSAWIHREGLAGVQDALGKSGPTRSGAYRSTEPEQVAWLRRYSNYLAPRVGILSADSLTLMAVWLRNLFLNLIVIVSFLVTLMLIPVALIPTVAFLQNYGSSMEEAATFLGLLLMPMGIAWNLSQAGNDPTVQRTWLLSTPGVFLTVMLPGTLAALAGSLWLFGPNAHLDSGSFLLLTVGFICLCGGIWLVRVALRRVQATEIRGDLRQALLFPLAGVVAACAALGILLLACRMKGLQDGGVRQTATLLTIGPPAFLFAFGVAGSVYVGIVGRAYFERSREWWGRMNAWFFIVATTWLIVTSSALFIPAILDWVIASLPNWLKVVTGLGWLGSLTAALATPRKTNLSAPRQYNLMRVLNAAALVFIIGFIVVLSFGTEQVLLKTASIAPIRAETLSELSVLNLQVSGDRSAFKSSVSVRDTEVPKLDAYIQAHMAELQSLLGATVSTTDIPFIYASLAFALTLLALFGWRVDVNKFSMHNLYKNRLIRCYLGASNDKRRPQPFAGFDDRDDPLLHELAHIPGSAGVVQRPLHIINTTLNIAQGKNLAWQERKGASFALTPHYCGYALSSVQGDTTEERIRRMPAGAPKIHANEPATEIAHTANLGNDYRPTRLYASLDNEERGFTLGMAMATSGAAASPNMGPATRPALAFVMTLFNVRLGRWSPNTAGSSWKSASPLFGIRCFLAELFGLSNEDSRFVYLSDGGHFDNMGLYELVRRKCSTIWLVDAAADFSRTFEDLGRAIRQCRIDFGVEVSIDLNSMRTPVPVNLPCVGYSRGVIDYGPGQEPGVLVYIKPTLSGQRNEPEDLIAYAASNPTFPHQSTANQFYDESEFESYRRLGDFIGAQCIEAHGSRLPFVEPPTVLPVSPDKTSSSLGSPPIWRLFAGLAGSALVLYLFLNLVRRPWLACGTDNLWSTYNSVQELLIGASCLKPGFWVFSKHGLNLTLPNLTELWLWFDNVLVTTYSALFIVGWRWFVRAIPTPRAGLWFPILVSMSVLGGFSEYVENFLLLGGLHWPTPFAAVRFFLFAVNLVLLFVFGLRAAWRLFIIDHTDGEDSHD